MENRARLSFYELTGWLAGRPAGARARWEINGER
jgi:hypothetical protein